MSLFLEELEQTAIQRIKKFAKIAAAYNAEINCANRMIDFFNKYHFDYRGLIPMGLAIDATGLNIY